MKKILLSSIALALCSMDAMAQVSETPTMVESPTAIQVVEPKKDYAEHLRYGLLDGRTIVKANLTGLALGSYGFYGERILSRNISLQLGYSFMPEKGISLPVIRDESALKSATFGYQMITPEVRFYLGKGYGRSFYISPYYRYEKYTLGGINMSYTSSSGVAQPLTFSGTTTAHSFGLSFGAQWLLGKRKNIVLDWNIIGAHYGSAKTSLDGYLKIDGMDRLNEKEKADVEKELKEFVNDLPAGSDNGYTVNFVNDDRGTTYGAQAEIKHPFAWIRMNISLGFRF